MVGIEAIAEFLPDEPRAIADLPERKLLTGPNARAFESLGIETVIAAEGGTGIDLAVEASRRVLEAAQVDPERLDVILLCQSRTPEYLMSSEATRLQQALGATGAASLALTDLGCVTISGAIQMARDTLLAREDCERVLIAFGSRSFGRRRFRNPVTITGDGAIALLVGRSERRRIVDIEIETNGRYWDLYRVDYRNQPPERWAEECKDVRIYSMELAIESRNRFRALNKRLLERNGLAPQDVDHWIMQNLSESAFGFYEKFLGVAFAASCRANLRRYGHLGNVDVVWNLESSIRSGEFSAGERVLVMNNSPVAAWSSMLVEV
jgi:3-oxoacyl-[acyl-carrier-protein] synthase III